MTRREWNLRNRVDTLTDERDHWKKVAGRKRKLAFVGRCVFCGDKTKGYARPSVCRAHSDLPALDPLYAEGLAAA